jgi:thiamine biosynthesis lipoprotein
VHVTDDHRSDASAAGQTVAIRDGHRDLEHGGRRWRRAGRTMHHIIDPHTALPVKATWRTVSVAAADCTQANIAATAALVRARAAPEWLEALELPARLVAWSGRATTVGGWPTA